MFTVEKEDISRILRDFGIFSAVTDFSELQRYHYEKNDPTSKDVRLIIRADLAGGRSVVVRFKHEPDVTLALVNAQCRFAGFLADNGIKTPALFLADRAYARWYTIRGYDVIVTVEAFAAGELREVSAEIAQKTGGLLARMHNIAQAGACHVPGGVLFDPLRENDLFSFAAFRRHEAFLRSVDGALYRGGLQRNITLFYKGFACLKTNRNTPCRGISATATCIRPLTAKSACSISTAAATPCSTTTR